MLSPSQEITLFYGMNLEILILIWILLGWLQVILISFYSSMRSKEVVIWIWGISKLLMECLSECNLKDLGFSGPPFTCQWVLFTNVLIELLPTFFSIINLWTLESWILFSPLLTIMGFGWVLMMILIEGLKTISNLWVLGYITLIFPIEFVMCGTFPCLRIKTLKL